MVKYFRWKEGTPLRNYCWRQKIRWIAFSYGTRNFGIHVLALICFNIVAYGRYGSFIYAWVCR